jgi:hypothetical protein
MNSRTANARDDTIDSSAESDGRQADGRWIRDVWVAQNMFRTIHRPFAIFRARGDFSFERNRDHHHHNRNVARVYSTKQNRPNVVQWIVIFDGDVGVLHAQMKKTRATREPPKDQWNGAEACHPVERYMFRWMNLCILESNELGQQLCRRVITGNTRIRTHISSCPWSQGTSKQLHLNQQVLGPCAHIFIHAQFQPMRPRWEQRWWQPKYSAEVTGNDGDSLDRSKSWQSKVGR